MSSAKCSVCGRELEATESINRGVGSKCAAKYANGVLAAGSSFEQIGELEASTDSYIIERLRRAKLAIGKGRISDAKLFLQLAAEHAALPMAA